MVFFFIYVYIKSYVYQLIGIYCWQEIDVGQCTGLCFGGKTQKCLYRDQTDSSKCLASLYGKQSSCTPARFEVYRYTTKDHQIKELISIKDCKCMWQPDAGNYYAYKKGNNLIYFELQRYVLW